MTDKLPWFPFFVNDWLLDDKVRRMGFTERGIYHHLLCLQWLDGSIPADLGNLKPSFGMATADQVSDALLLSVVERCFPVDVDDPSIRRNAKLAEILRQQEVKRSRQVEGGRKGGLRLAQAKLKLTSSISEPESETEPNKDKDLPAVAGNGNGSHPKVVRVKYPAFDVKPYAALWEASVGQPPFARLTKALAPVHASAGNDLFKAFNSFVQGGDAKFGPEYFAARWKNYLPAPCFHPDGSVNPAGWQRAGVEVPRG